MVYLGSLVTISCFCKRFPGMYKAHTHIPLPPPTLALRIIAQMCKWREQNVDVVMGSKWGWKWENSQNC